MTWLIDSSGIAWPKKAHPIALWNAACDPVGYAVSDLGFIYLRVLTGRATVSFNPSRVGRKTMTSTFYLLAGEQPERIALSYRGECPNFEIFGSLGAALRRIEELVESRPAPIAALSQRRRSLDRLPQHAAEPIAELLRAWSSAAGYWTSERQAALFTVVALKDMVIARNPRRTDRIVYYHWGASFDFVGPRWMQIAPGKDIEDQPFPELGKRVASRYRCTLTDGAPQIDDIELTLSIGGSTIFGRSYTRLLLPWNEPGADRYVTLIRFDKNTRPLTEVSTRPKVAPY